MKQSRQKAIINVISKADIENQNQLIDELQKAGVNATQATISRDIKELRIVKELSPMGKYRYIIAGENISNHSGRLKTIFKESVTSCVRAQNIVVIKTLPGLAPAACSAIDRMEIRDLAGSIAGDDTAFLAMMSEEAAEIFLNEIQSYLV